MPLSAGAEHTWRDKRKCAKLTPQQADALFFPGPGGKSKAAKNFCSDCPVLSNCLEEQLRFTGPGFWAGTTEEERRRMADFLKLVPSQLDDFVPPITRPRLRPVRRDANVYNDPLFGIEGPSQEEELSMFGL